MSDAFEPMPYHAGGEPTPAIPLPPTTERLLADLEDVVAVLRRPEATPELADLATQLEHLNDPAPSVGMRRVAAWAQHFDLVVDPHTRRAVRDRLMTLVADRTQPEPVRWRLAWVLSQHTERWPGARGFWQWLLDRDAGEVRGVSRAATPSGSPEESEDPLLWWVRAEWLPQAICLQGPHAPAEPWSLWLAHAQTLDGPALVRAVRWLHHSFGRAGLAQLPRPLRERLVRAQQEQDQQDAAWRDPAQEAFRRLDQLLRAKVGPLEPWQTDANRPDLTPECLVAAWTTAYEQGGAQSDVAVWVAQAITACPSPRMDGLLAAVQQMATDATDVPRATALQHVRDQRTIRALTHAASSDAPPTP